MGLPKEAAADVKEAEEFWLTFSISVGRDEATRWIGIWTAALSDFDPLMV